MTQKFFRGEVVLVVTSRNNRFTEEMVDRITPTGRIRLSSGKVYTADGSRRIGESSSFYRTRLILKKSQEGMFFLAKHEYWNMREEFIELSKTQLDQLTQDQLSQLITILKTKPTEE